MRVFSLITFIALLVGCSGAKQQETEADYLPQCLSLCSNNFAACTQEYPGDFAMCRQERDNCEQTCEEKKALERMEEDDDEVIVPTDSAEEPVPTPEEEPSDNPLETNEPKPEGSEETPQ